MPKSETRTPKVAAFQHLKSGFLAEVMPVLTENRFEKSVFSAHFFGKEGKDLTYIFLSLDEDVLDVLCFRISKNELSVKAFYNRIGLNRPLSNLSEFHGKTGLSLMLMPLRSTEKELHRWAPVPFLWIPRLYAVRSLKSVEVAEQSAAKAMIDLSNDMAQIDIIRAEWTSEFSLMTIDVDSLEKFELCFIRPVPLVNPKYPTA